LLAFVAVVVTLAFDAGALVTLGVLFVVVVPFEKLFPRHPQRVRRPQLGTDLAHAILSAPLNVVGIGLGVVLGFLSLVWLPALLFRPLVLALPGGVRTLLGIVLFDVLVYWAHRFAHEIPFLWRFHAVHHSTQHLDWVSGFRLHPLDWVFFAPAFVFLVVAGFTPELAGVLVAVQIVIGIFLHANVRWHLRPLQKLVATPEFHHWHHANEAAAHNTNYAGLLPLWDLVFGTYRVPTDRRPLRYGVSDPVPAGLVSQLWYPLRGLRNPLTIVRHPWRSLVETVAMLRRGLVSLGRSARRTPWRAPWVAWRQPTPTVTPF